jgi:hypothetical protein
VKARPNAAGRKRVSHDRIEHLREVPIDPRGLSSNIIRANPPMKPTVATSGSRCAVWGQQFLDNYIEHRTRGGCDPVARDRRPNAFDVTQLANAEGFEPPDARG